jgi:hypothetical protein
MERKPRIAPQRLDRALGSPFFRVDDNMRHQSGV